MTDDWPVLGLIWARLTGAVLGMGLGMAVAGAEEERPLRLMVTAGCFGNAGEDAARLGAKVLARHLGEELGWLVEVRLSRTADEVGAELAAGGGDVVMMTGDLWGLAGAEARGVVPVMQSRAAGEAGANWILLVREPWDVAAVGRGHVVVAGDGEGDLPLVWLERWRRSHGMVLVPVPTTHRISREPNGALGLMRTYFGKTDACLVPAAVYATACGENPDVAVRLKQVAASPCFPGAVVGVKLRAGDDGAVVLRRAVEQLALTRHGAALAALVGARRFELFSATGWPAVAALVPSGRVPGAPAPAAMAGHEAALTRAPFPCPP